MPYHVRINRKSDPSWDEVKLDLTQEQLEAQFLRPYREGRPIVVNGRVIPLNNLSYIKISFTKETSQQLLPVVRAERSQSFVIASIPDEWYLADKGEDVTDKFITAPPGTGKSPKEEKKVENGPVKIKIGWFEIEGPLGIVLTALVALAIGIVLTGVTVYEFQQPTFLVEHVVSRALTATTTARPPTTPPPPPTNRPTVGGLSKIFPQIGAGETFVWLTEPGDLSYQYINDPSCAHSGTQGLRIVYDFTKSAEAGQPFPNGGWGVNWLHSPNKTFDASHFSDLTFWVRGALGNETFLIGMKDIKQTEYKVPSKDILTVEREWKPFSLPLSQFKVQGVNLEALDNIHFAFESPRDKGSICIDDIALVSP